jgi:hypothetical protein
MARKAVAEQLRLGRWDVEAVVEPHRTVEGRDGFAVVLRIPFSMRSFADGALALFRGKGNL